MLIYVASRYGKDSDSLKRAIKVTHDLQIKDLVNCYISPVLAFSHLDCREIDYDAEMELRLDLLSIADRLIIVDKISEGIRTELDFAKLVKMEVMELDENGKLQPFTERVGKFD